MIAGSSCAFRRTESQAESGIEPMSASVDFSQIAHQYDATRNLPPPILSACFDYLTEAGFLPRTGCILDAGCGTGQLSMPLAERGLQIVGIDISPDMIAIARSKSQDLANANYRIGDVRRIDAACRSFDCVLVSKLLQHIEDWKLVCREFVRVLRPGGHIIQINERGAFGNPVRAHFTELAAARGYKLGFIGLDPHSERELTLYLEALGCSSLPLDVRFLKWSSSISFGEALNQIERRLFAEFWQIPQHDYVNLIRETKEWIGAVPEGFSTKAELEPFLVAAGFRTPG